MLHLVFLIADTTMVADFREGRWHVCQDNLTGESEKATWTPEQLVSVAALLLGGEETVFASAAYPIAERAVVGWADNVRPIP